MLATLAFVNPHRAIGVDRTGGWRPPTRARTPWPRIPGLGGPLDLDEFHAATATTAFQVLVDGVLVHAWYADGLGPRDLFLGASATKSVLAHLVGRPGWTSTLPSTPYVRSSPAPATAGCRCATSPG